MTASRVYPPAASYPVISAEANYSDTDAFGASLRTEFAHFALALFETAISRDGKTLQLRNAFRDQMPRHIRANAVLTEQARYLLSSGGGIVLDRVELPTIINRDTLRALQYKGTPLDQTLVGRLASRVAANLGYDVLHMQCSSIKYDGSIRGGKYCNGLVLVQPRVRTSLSPP